MNPFIAALEARWKAGARVCIGLDSDIARLPEALGRNPSIDRQLLFNVEIVKATADLALVYKPNIAFYPGPDGLRALIKTVEFIHTHAPGVPVALDAKRADIGKTNHGYVCEAFDVVDADAVTINPYFGKEAVKPFLDRADKGIIVLCRTSNPGAGEFQDLIVDVPLDGVTTLKMPLYEKVARNVAHDWNGNGNCLLVVGATAPEELARVRALVNDLWLLIPGIGSQGGDLEQVVRNGLAAKGAGAIINSSSGITFASSGKDYREAARNATLELTRNINRLLAA